MRRIACILLLLLSACDGTDEAAHCLFQVAAGDEPSRVASLGSDDGGFTPYAEGGSVSLVYGQQGGLMITPRVGVPAGAEDPETLCGTLTITSYMDGATTPAERLQEVLLLRRSGDLYRSARMQQFLGYSESELVGHTLTMTTELVTSAFVASGSVSVELQ
ncbi:MAG: hypothetical protein H6744_13490 [Deltaproteobacteria bacterium]|nr:hypothetical protein [Deltaproteobacteria bacterium]